MDNQLSELAGKFVNKGGVFCITRTLSLVLSDAVTTRTAEPCPSQPHIWAYQQSCFFPSSAPPLILHSNPSVLLRPSSNLLFILALHSLCRWWLKLPWERVSFEFALPLPCLYLVHRFQPIIFLEKANPASAPCVSPSLFPLLQPIYIHNAQHTIEMPYFVSCSFCLIFFKYVSSSHLYSHHWDQVITISHLDFSSSLVYLNFNPLSMLHTYLSVIFLFKTR